MKPTPNQANAILASAALITFVVTKHVAWNLWR